MSLSPPAAKAAAEDRKAIERWRSNVPSFKCQRFDRSGNGDTGKQSIRSAGRSVPIVNAGKGDQDKLPARKKASEEKCQRRKAGELSRVKLARRSLCKGSSPGQRQKRSYSARTVWLAFSVEQHKRTPWLWRTCQLRVRVENKRGFEYTENSLRNVAAKISPR